MYPQPEVLPSILALEARMRSVDPRFGDLPEPWRDELVAAMAHLSAQAATPNAGSSLIVPATSYVVDHVQWKLYELALAALLAWPVGIVATANDFPGPAISLVTGGFVALGQLCVTFGRYSTVVEPVPLAILKILADSEEPMTEGEIRAVLDNVWPVENGWDLRSVSEALDRLCCATTQTGHAFPLVARVGTDAWKPAPGV